MLYKFMGPLPQSTNLFNLLTYVSKAISGFIIIVYYQHCLAIGKTGKALIAPDPCGLFIQFFEYLNRMVK